MSATKRQTHNDELKINRRLLFSENTKHAYTIFLGVNDYIIIIIITLYTRILYNIACVCDKGVSVFLLRSINEITKTDLCFVDGTKP